MKRIRNDVKKNVDEGTEMTLRANESAKDGIVRFGDALIEVAIRLERHPSGDPVEDIHFFRTTTKRMRAMLQLVRPVIGKAEFARENALLKKAADRLAVSRDQAVVGKTLRELSKSASGNLSPASLGGKRQDEPGDRAALHNGALSRAARDFEKARFALYQLDLREEGWAAIGPGLTSVYRQARRRMRSAFAHSSDQAFHRWRIRVKYLFYELKWLQPVWPSRFAAQIKRLHKLETKLGEDHDLVILQRELETSSAPFDSSEARRLRELAVRKSNRLRRSCKSLGKKIFAEKPGIFCRECHRHWKRWHKGI